VLGALVLSRDDDLRGCRTERSCRYGCEDCDVVIEDWWSWAHVSSLLNAATFFRCTIEAYINYLSSAVRG
jgi:hypothetical protein